MRLRQIVTGTSKILAGLEFVLLPVQATAIEVPKSEISITESEMYKMNEICSWMLLNKEKYSPYEEKDANNNRVDVSVHEGSYDCDGTIYHIKSELKFFKNPSKLHTRKLFIKAPGFDKPFVYDCLKEGNPHREIIDKIFKYIQSQKYN